MARKNIFLINKQQEIIYLKRNPCLDPPNSSTGCKKCIMTQRLTDAATCLPCTYQSSDFKILIMSDGTKKCCPSSCSKNCTQNSRLNKTCADCSISYEKWENEKKYCISGCSGLINNGICFKLPDGQTREDSYYDNESGTIKKIICDPSLVILEGKCASTCDSEYELKGQICFLQNCPISWIKYPSGSCDYCDKEGVYFSTITRLCSKCHNSCKYCKGPSEFECSQCIDGTYFEKDTLRCINCDFQNGQYIQDYYCMNCHSTCQQCRGPLETDCLICKPNFYFDKNHTCVFCDISNGYFIDSNKSCQKCDQLCKTCNGPLKSNCTSCQPRQYMSYTKR